MNYEDYLTAKAIILKSLKTGTLLTEYKLWDTLDYDARLKALADSRCPFCHKIKELTGTVSHYFGTDPACTSCSDEFNYPHLFREGKRLPLYEVQI